MVFKLLFTIVLSTMVIAMSSFQDNGFNSYRGLYLFAPGPEDSVYQEAMKAINDNRQALEERDMRVFSVYADGGKMEDNSTGLSAQEANDLREKYRIPPGEFTLLLIGKDRYEKSRWNQEFHSLQKVFDLIDSMPMRRREMRERKDDDG